MYHRINRKKYSIYAFDLESHNDNESIEKQETSMWLGCFINENNKIDDDSSYFYSMKDFIDKLEELSCAKRHKNSDSRPCKNIAIFIYNLSFEWSFILPELKRRGFIFKEAIEKEDEFVYNSVSTKSVSSVWMCRLKFKKNGGDVIFRDLAKIYGGGLGKVAKAFNLPTQKGEIDYRLNRLHEYKITQEEKEYCFKDTRIIIDILLKMLDKNDNDFWNSVSMASYSMRRLLKSAYPRTTKPYKKFRENYPELDEKESEFLRHSVGGGITYAPSRWQFKEITQKVLHIDAHQMHPTQIYAKPFPYGFGEYFEGEPTKLFKHINCCHIKISYSGVKLHSIISLIGLPFIEDRELYVWDFEIPTMKKVYEDLEITYIDGYCYKARFLPWRNYVADNYRDRLVAKKNNDAFNTLFYKLLNNAGAYGKFLEKPHNEIFANDINALGIIDSNIIPKDEKDLRINARYTYIPVGSCIPAYSRVSLIETALLFGWEKIVYFDTDSIFCLLDDETWNIWETKIDHTDFLGGWGLEEICDRSMFSAPKRYKTETNGIATIKAGGINFNKYKEEIINKRIEEENLIVDDIEKKDMIDKYQIPFDEVNIISSSWQVQRAYRVRGGTLIEFQTKEMKVQDKYIDILHKNTNI